MKTDRNNNNNNNSSLRWFDSGNSTKLNTVGNLRRFSSSISMASIVIIFIMFNIIASSSTSSSYPNHQVMIHQIHQQSSKSSLVNRKNNIISKGHGGINKQNFHHHHHRVIFASPRPLFVPAHPFLDAPLRYQNHQDHQNRHHHSQHLQRVGALRQATTFNHHHRPHHRFGYRQLANNDDDYGQFSPHSHHQHQHHKQKMIADKIISLTRQILAIIRQRGHQSTKNIGRKTGDVPSTDGMAASKTRGGKAAAAKSSSGGANKLVGMLDSFAKLTQLHNQLYEKLGPPPSASAADINTQKLRNHHQNPLRLTKTITTNQQHDPNMISSTSTSFMTTILRRQQQQQQQQHNGEKSLGIGGGGGNPVRAYQHSLHLLHQIRQKL